MPRASPGRNAFGPSGQVAFTLLSSAEALPSQKLSQASPSGGPPEGHVHGIMDAGTLYSKSHFSMDSPRERGLGRTLPSLFYLPQHRQQPYKA